MAQTNANNQDLIFAEEAFVVEVQGFLYEIMEKKGISRADLARAMEVSRSRITQIFSDDCTNLTIRLLAKAMFALGETPKISCAKDEVIHLDDWKSNAQATSSQFRWNEVFTDELVAEQSCANDIFESLAITRRAKESYRIAA